MTFLIFEEDITNQCIEPNLRNLLLFPKKREQDTVCICIIKSFLLQCIEFSINTKTYETCYDKYDQLNCCWSNYAKVGITKMLLLYSNKPFRNVHLRKQTKMATECVGLG